MEAPTEIAAISFALTRPAIIVSTSPIEFCAICASKIGVANLINSIICVLYLCQFVIKCPTFIVVICYRNITILFL